MKEGRWGNDAFCLGQHETVLAILATHVLHMRSYYTLFVKVSSKTVKPCNKFLKCFKSRKHIIRSEFYVIMLKEIHARKEKHLSLEYVYLPDFSDIN